MINNELIRAAIFSAPLVTSLVCLTLAALDAGYRSHPVIRRIRRQTIVKYVVIALAWLGIILHQIAPGVFLWGMAAIIPLIMLGHVLTFRWVCTITDPGTRGAFPVWHYFAPTLVFVTAVMVGFALDREALSQLVYGHPHSALTLTVIGVAIVSSILYPLAGAREIRRFRSRSAESTGGDVDGGHTMALGWVLGFMVAETIVLPLPLGGLFLGFEVSLSSGYVWLVSVLPSVVIYILSLLDFFSDNYVVVESEEPKAVAAESNQRLKRERLENYLDTRKPWLNPEYRITDMARDLYSNRAYISAFINKEYGVNFNSFVNDYRLREVERLRAEATQKGVHVSTLQLILNAGFNSYRSYLRAKNRG
ncbi:MAG: hypothetical protein LBU97_02340 [Alistipes sp.]|jgi:AraC-like DNA-binding protein|nr:hypothetical protein [Alistipes sp.]